MKFLSNMTIKTQIVLEQKRKKHKYIYPTTVASNISG